jgi:hypothetical protein
VFDPYLIRFNYAQHLNLTCTLENDVITSQTLPTFIGEWSVAYKVPSNEADTEPFPNEEQQAFMKQYALAQMWSFTQHPLGNGWFFWNFRTESAVFWDWQVGVDNKWLLDKYPNRETLNGCAGYVRIIKTEEFPTTTTTEEKTTETVVETFVNATTSSEARQTLVTSEMTQEPKEETTVTQTTEVEELTSTIKIPHVSIETPVSEAIVQRVSVGILTFCLLVVLNGL